MVNKLVKSTVIALATLAIIIISLPLLGCDLNGIQITLPFQVSFSLDCSQQPNNSPQETPTSLPMLINPPQETPIPTQILNGTSYQISSPSSDQNITKITSEISSIALSNALLAIGTRDGDIFIYSINGAVNRECKCISIGVLKLDGRVTGLTFSPDGMRLAAGIQDGRITLYQISDQQTDNWQKLVLDPPSSGSVRTVAFSPDRPWIAVGYDDGTIFVWENGQIAFRLDKQNTSVKKVEFSPDGKRLLSVYESGNIQVWETKPWRQMDTPHLPFVVQSFAFDPNGGLLLFSGESVFEMDSGGRVILRKRASTLIRSGASARNIMALGLDDGSIELVSGNDTLRLKIHNAAVEYLDFSPDGAFLVSVSRDNNVYYIYVDEVISHDNEQLTEIGEPVLYLASTVFIDRHCLSTSSDIYSKPVDDSLTVLATVYQG